MANLDFKVKKQLNAIETLLNSSLEKTMIKKINTFFLSVTSSGGLNDVVTIFSSFLTTNL